MKKEFESLVHPENIRTALMTLRLTHPQPTAEIADIGKMLAEKLRRRGWVVDLSKNDPKDWFKKPA